MPERFPAKVAQPSNKKQLVSPNATKPQYKNIYGNQLLLLNDKTNSENLRFYEIDLLARFETIGGHQKNSFKVLRHFYENGCSFAKDIQKTLKIARDTSHRIIEKLVSAGFIEPLTKITIPNRHGPKPTMYGVKDVTRKEIDNAISRNMMYSSKSFVYVDRLYQTTLGEIERQTIQYSKIVSLSRRQGNSPGYRFIDIARQVAKIHSSKGITVLNYSG